jgi:hypothetical protein
MGADLAVQCSKEAEQARRDGIGDVSHTLKTALEISKTTLL